MQCLLVEEELFAGTAGGVCPVGEIDSGLTGFAASNECRDCIVGRVRGTASRQEEHAHREQCVCQLLVDSERRHVKSNLSSM